MGQQFLAQHKQDYISLSSTASSLAAQILVDVQEVGGGEKSPNYCIQGRDKPDNLAAVRQVHNTSPLLLPHTTRISGSASSVSEAVRQISYRESITGFVYLFDNATREEEKQGNKLLESY